jgi:hypothetical protein
VNYLFFPTTNNQILNFPHPNMFLFKKASDFLKDSKTNTKNTKQQEKPNPTPSTSPSPDVPYTSYSYTLEEKAPTAVVCVLFLSSSSSSLLIFNLQDEVIVVTTNVAKPEIDPEALALQKLPHVCTFSSSITLETMN